MVLLMERLGEMLIAWFDLNKNVVPIYSTGVIIPQFKFCFE